MKSKWFAKDGSVFSEEVITKKSQEFRLGSNFKYNEAIAFNVGNEIANHMVKLHNEYIHSRLGLEKIS